MSSHQVSAEVSPLQLKSILESEHSVCHLSRFLDAIQLGIVEDEPSEPVRNSTRPLNMVMARPSEPLRDLPMPLVWEPARDNDPVTDLVNPLVSRPARENEPVSVLKNPACSARLVDAVSDPVRVL